MEKKSRVVTEKERKITAYHEAGHAILFHVLPDVGPVYSVSIIPTGVGAAGYTMPLPEKDEMFLTKGKMLQEDKITNETKNKCYMCHVVIIRYKNQVR